MKNKKGFTLIELLAVIIILGVLMIIAVPAVTKYINDSRKSSYVDIAKNISSGVRNLVHSGELDLNDLDTTYYIDGSCIKTENGFKSPYGEFRKAYVAVTLTSDGSSHEYYWTSVDETGTGVKRLINIERFDTDIIEDGIDPNDIVPNVGIDGRKNIIVVSGDNCSASSPELAERQINSLTRKYKGECPESYTSTIYWALQDKNSDNVMDKLIISDQAVTGTYSGSFAGDTYFSAEYRVPWVAGWSSDSLSYYVSEIEIKGEVVPTNTSNWFYNVGTLAQTMTENIEKLEVCRVTKMNSMFHSFGLKVQNFELNLNEWNTSNVTEMSSMFRNTAQDSTFVNIDISNWNTSKVTDMSGMFKYTGAYSQTFNLNISNWNVSSVKSISNMFEHTGDDATNFNIIIPKTNSNGLDNTSSVLYGSNSSYSVAPPTGKSFVLAN